MSDYDFKTLNDKEFEILCADLLSIAFSNKFERFKPGRDGGVDGRYFADEEEVVLQCKHWASTPFDQLIRRLKVEERPKLDKLKPSKYVVAVSLPLSRDNKKDIADILGPHLKSPHHIYGKEDLNDILKAAPEIERKHYKLWLYSSSVLSHIMNNAIIGRSVYSLEEIREASCRYVITSNHDKALRKLEERGVVIITGAPGIGKTTLAEHLCIHYVAQGFSFLKINREISEAESPFDPESKQIFYFDDFLGRNYLEALTGHEGNEITQFLRRVNRNKNKRFILTSRSTILNQGKLLIDALLHDNIEEKEYEIKIESLREIDRAKMLYNHIWHSKLDAGYIDEFYNDRKYKSVISHNNFNPRLISYITDAGRLKLNGQKSYWEFVEKSLANPEYVWENPFVAQQDDFGRSLILLVVLHGKKISEARLSEAYHEYLALPENKFMSGRSDFLTNLSILTGSFLNRYIAEAGQVFFDLFNPSIGDFVLSRYVKNKIALKNAIASLRTRESLSTLRSLVQNKLISKADGKIICLDVLGKIAELEFVKIVPSYTTDAFNIYLECDPTIGDDTVVLQKVARHALVSEGEYLSGMLLVAIWAFRAQISDAEWLVNFAHSKMGEVSSDDEISNFSALVRIIPEDIEGRWGIVEAFEGLLYEIISDLEEFIDTQDIYDICGYGEYDEAQRDILSEIERKLDDLGVGEYRFDLDSIVDNYDVKYNMDQYFEKQISRERGEYDEHVPDRSISEVDDLFDRS